MGEVYGCGTFAFEIYCGNRNDPRGAIMRIKLTSVFVDDQEKALKFYTEVLGFVKKTELPAGDFKWLTVVSEGSKDIELLLEPDANAPAREYQKAIYAAGIPATSFFVDDIEKEHKRMVALGVSFKMKPTESGTAKVAVFDDTCGNLIQLVEN
jgi:predicted enzyme related to lactoylglutathione lyase